MRYLMLAICILLMAEDVTAQQSAEHKAQVDRGIAILKRSGMLLYEATERAIEQCNSARVVVPRPSFDFATMADTTVETVVSIEWSGACAEGKRDGDGILSWVQETRYMRQLQSATTQRAEGRFVKGRRLGLWCMTMTQQTNGKPSALGLISGCEVLTGNLDGLVHRHAELYRKQPDGTWRLFQASTPTDTTLAAGALEAQSAKVLADAATGKTDVKIELVAHTRSLDDLVAGSRIVIARSATPISLKDKRIAVVLSSRTLSELERFKRERQALIASSSGLGGNAAEWRTKFIATSLPDHLLTTVAKMVLKHAKTVQSADDLVGLKKGEFDYALVLDWKHMTRFDLLGKYASFPIASPGQEGPAPACESLGTFLISPDLKAVKQGAPYPNCLPKWAGETGDESYMAKLAMFFEDHWGQNARVTMWLEEFLIRN